MYCHKIRLQRFPKKQNSNVFVKLLPATCPCHSSCLDPRSCILISRLCVNNVFEILTMYQCYQPDSTVIASGSEQSQLFHSSPVLFPVTEKRSTFFHSHCQRLFSTSLVSPSCDAASLCGSFSQPTTFASQKIGLHRLRTKNLCINPFSFSKYPAS